MQVKGHIALEITCGVGSDSKAIEVNYLILHDLSHYIIILDGPAITVLGGNNSTCYLVLKFPLSNGRMETV